MTLIDQSVRNCRITVNSAVPQKRPIPPHVFERLQIHFAKQNFFFVVRRFRDYPAKRVTNERPTPKLKPRAWRRVPANVSGLMSHSIHNRNIHAVRYRMRALNGAPCVILRLTKLGFLRRMPPNRRGVKQYMSTLQRRKPRALRIPLIPANQSAYAPGSSIKRAKSEITGSEIKFLVIKWIVRDVHFAVKPAQRAIRIENYCRVVIHARSTLLKQRRNQDNAMLLS